MLLKMQSNSNIEIYVHFKGNKRVSNPLTVFLELDTDNGCLHLMLTFTIKTF